jgi:hypothetical protein
MNLEGNLDAKPMPDEPRRESNIRPEDEVRMGTQPIPPKAKSRRESNITTEPRSKDEPRRESIIMAEARRKERGEVTRNGGSTQHR